MLGFHFNHHGTILNRGDWRASKGIGWISGTSTNGGRRPKADSCHGVADYAPATALAGPVTPVIRDEFTRGARGVTWHVTATMSRS